MLSAVSHPSLMSELVKREQENQSTSTFLGRRLTAHTAEFKFPVPSLKLLYFTILPLLIFFFLTAHKENMTLPTLLSLASFTSASCETRTRSSLLDVQSRKAADFPGRNPRPYQYLNSGKCQQQPRERCVGEVFMSLSHNTSCIRFPPFGP